MKFKEYLKSKLEEGSMSPALQKRLKAMRRKLRCSDCAFELPVYPGAYPKKCPECGGDNLQKP